MYNIIILDESRRYGDQFGVVDAFRVALVLQLCPQNVGYRNVDSRTERRTVVVHQDYVVAVEFRYFRYLFLLQTNENRLLLLSLYRHQDFVTCLSTFFNKLSSEYQLLISFCHL